jgi:hypothetical protein
MRARIHTLKRVQVLPGTLREVFAFFERPENLARITPPWLAFRMHTVPPLSLRRGAVIDYTIRWMGIPVRWRTLITDYDPPNMFVDTQIQGPYSLWEHTHQFRPCAGGVEMTDIVRYQLPLGLVGSVAHALIVGRQLEAIFDFRANVIPAIVATARGKKQ